MVAANSGIVGIKNIYVPVENFIGAHLRLLLSVNIM